MGLYLIFFGFGFVGLVMMAALGFAGGHGGSHSGHGHLGGGARGEMGHHFPGASGAHATVSHAGHGSAGPVASHGIHGHGINGHHSHHGDNTGANHGSVHSGGNQLRSFLMGWLTPRVLFTLSLGGGAAGMAVYTVVGEPWRGLIALSGGALLEKVVVSPLWVFLMGFASHPARTLESAVFEEAVALTNFDQDGCGIVSIQLDGHEMRVLGRLGAQFAQERIHQGDSLIVESVDAARGRCVVTPLPPSGTGLPA